MKNFTTSIIFGLAIVISSIFLANAYVNRTKTDGKIQVTGLGKADFTSDLIVWEGRFVVTDFSLQNAYELLEKNKLLTKKYLVSKGVPEEKLVFSAVNTINKSKPLYADNGRYLGDEFDGYELSQSITIESKNVEKIEKISREVTELLNQGVQFYSDPPRYYYTKLADLKIEMISKATEDARLRAEKISEYSGGRLGELVSAKMGVFQITGQNSKEDYSWGGTFNTMSKNKTASITMKLVYKTK